MFPAFSTALSALSGTSKAIDVVGNNLANLNTTGYKATRVEFSDLMSQQLSSAAATAQVGMGIGNIQTFANFSQGSVTTTSGATDVAIEGNGFFVVKDSSNNTLYTRDGSFQVDSGGNLITSTGQKVQGWSAVAGVVNPNGAVSDITVPLGSVSPATATTSMSLNINLNADAAIASATPTTASFSAPIDVVDSLGASHTLTVCFNKTAANTWSYEVDIPNADLTTAGTAGLTTNTSQLSTGSFTFSSTGALDTTTTSPIALTVAGLTDGAADMSINWNVLNSTGGSNITQYSQTSSLESKTQNGIVAGQVTGVSLQDGGMVVAKYSNGQQVVFGQLALASISNPQTLASVGDNNLQATFATTTPAIGAAGTAGRGKLVGGALESSTADMATEFTNLLAYERSYQAASRVITTSDQLMQETVNLIRA